MALVFSTDSSDDTVGKGKLLIPFVANGNINNGTEMRLSSSSMGDSVPQQPFITPFDGTITIASVSWKIFNKNTDVAIHVNGAIQQFITSTNQREVLTFNVPVTQGDAIGVRLNENPSGPGANNDLVVFLVLEEA